MISHAPGATSVPSLAAALAGSGLTAGPVVEAAGRSSATWGLPGAGPLHRLSAVARQHDTDLGDDALAAILRRRDTEALATLLPTFAAALLEPDGATVVAIDALGFRHVYSCSGPGWAAVSTSSRVLAELVGAQVDRSALAVQSLLGWQLGLATLFEGVEKIPPGTIVELSSGVLRETRPPAPVGRRLPIDLAVGEAAAVLREHLAAYVDDHPDLVLQLTGGQDSRLLLSAIPPERRRGLHAVTLGLPGNPDVVIAADLAARNGMHHEVLSLDGLDDIGPEEAWHRAASAARRLDGTADPLARAALDVAEADSAPGPRLSGLGGEVARGFYYVGRGGAAPVTMERTRRLVAWRMFVNEAVPLEALDPGFATWARDLATDRVHDALRSSGAPWFAATDELYLGQRMHRWAGGTDTAVCLERPSVNPMLDDRFLSVAAALAPDDKRHSRFLARLQVALDPALAALPLEGRPAPAAFADASLANRSRQGIATARKAGRKVRQRLAGHNRAPAGGPVLAERVTSHWRTNPDLLDVPSVRSVIAPAWLDQVLAGALDPPPSAVALLVNLAAVAERARPQL